VYLMKVILEAHRGHYYIRYLGCILSSKMRIVFVHYKIKSFYNVSVCTDHSMFVDF
jgi:hypothetical protein